MCVSSVYFNAVSIVCAVGVMAMAPEAVPAQAVPLTDLQTVQQVAQLDIAARHEQSLVIFGQHCNDLQSIVGGF